MSIYSQRVMIMNNAILTDEEKEIFKKLVRPEIVVNISRYYLLDSERILIRYKEFITYLDKVLENVPRKDMFYKDKIRKESIEVLELIIKIGFDEEKNINDKIIVRSKLGVVDFLLDRLFNLKYISEKQIYKLGLYLSEIIKMINGIYKNGSKI